MDTKGFVDYDDLDRKEITIEKWGGVRLLIEEMTGEQRDSAIRAAQEGERINDEIFAEQMIMICVKNPDTRQSFFDLNSVRVLKTKSWRVVDQIASAVFEINGMNKTAQERTEKNCGGGIPNADSI